MSAHRPSGSTATSSRSDGGGKAKRGNAAATAAARSIVRGSGKSGKDEAEERTSQRATSADNSSTPTPHTQNMNKAAAGAAKMPRTKHALEKPRCRAATALARDCHDLKQLAGLPTDVFSLYLDGPPGTFLSFVVCIVPKESLWKGVTFCFRCEIPTTKPKDYPYRPPAVTSVRGFKYYHPSISLVAQKVSARALLETWSPKMGLKGFCWMLHELLVAPDPELAANTRACRDMVDDPDKFQRDVQGSLNGSRLMLKPIKSASAREEEFRFPSKFAQAKKAAEPPKNWVKIR